MRICKNLLLSILIAASAFAAGCKATPAPNSGFLDNAQLMSGVNRVPFDRSYWDPSLNFASYQELYIAPVNTDYVLAQNLWEKASVVNLNANVKDDIRKVAEYTQQAFEKAATTDPAKHFQIVKTPGPNTLVLETALVQIVPSKAELNAIGLAFWEAGAAEMVAKTASGSEDMGKGLIAIEGRVRLGMNGKVLAMFADRERPKDAIINLKSLSWWDPVKSVCDDWAQQFIAVADAPKGQVIKPTPHFELLIW